MNCQPGDLALVIHGPDAGKTVTCVRLVERGEIIPTPQGPHVVEGWALPMWHVDRPVTCASSAYGHLELPLCRDARLMPIRPERDEDLEETEQTAAANEYFRALNAPITESSR